MWIKSDRGEESKTNCFALLPELLSRCQAMKDISANNGWVALNNTPLFFHPEHLANTATSQVIRLDLGVTRD